MQLTISIGEKEVKVLNKRSKENLLTLKEQVEDIIRRSCINQINKNAQTSDKVDDNLVAVFSRVKKNKKK